MTTKPSSLFVSIEYVLEISLYNIIGHGDSSLANDGSGESVSSIAQ